MSERVRAIELGFRGGRRYKKGDVFYVPNGSKSKWYLSYPEEPKVQEKPSSNKAAPAGPAPGLDLFT